MSSHDEPIDLVTNWLVESESYSREFEEYSSALSKFNKISKEGTQVILYEIKKNASDGKTVKKTPLLNSKRTKSKSPLFKRIVSSKEKDKTDTAPKNKSKFKELRIRILILAVVLSSFIAMMLIMDRIAG